MCTTTTTITNPACSLHTALPCFSVADHNTDGVLQYDEFVLLLNHITAEISNGGNSVVSTKVCRQLFKEASEAGHPHGITPSVFASAVHGELWMQTTAQSLAGRVLTRNLGLALRLLACRRYHYHAHCALGQPA